MTAKLHKLELVKPNPSIPVTRALEGLLERARKGDFYAIAGALLGPGGEISIIVCGDPDAEGGSAIKLVVQLLGATEVVKDELLDKLSLTKGPDHVAS